MIIELEQKLRRQISAKEQPEAFMTAWRLVHMTLRAFLINKLSEKDALQRVVAGLRPEDLPNTEDLIRHPHLSVTMQKPLTLAVAERLIRKINKANDKELFAKYLPLVTGVDLANELERDGSQKWSEYCRIVMQARHFVAHGKLYGDSSSLNQTYEDLTESLLLLWGTLYHRFCDDISFKHTIMDGPLPVIAECDFCPKTGTLHFRRPDDMVRPHYGDHGEDLL